LLIASKLLRTRSCKVTMFFQLTLEMAASHSPLQRQ
jgi:hypothetical protein